MFRCWAVRNVLDLYVDSRLTPSRRDRVRRHLSDCDACRAEAGKLSSAKIWLAKLAPEAPPAGLAASILEKLAEGAEPAPSREIFVPTLGQAAALAALVLIFAAQKGPGLSSQAYAGQETRVEAP